MNQQFSKVNEEIDKFTVGDLIPLLVINRTSR